MAQTRKAETRKKAAAPSTARPRRRALRFVLRWTLRVVAGVWVLILLAVLVFAMLPPPRTPYMLQESARLDGIRYDWTDMDEIAPVMARAVVAAEDANFCLHWGFDMVAIRRALDEGTGRGASTITQQVVKNVFLWHGRNWGRKALEAVITPVVETFWSKRRILEVYLNVAEFDAGVFGVQAAAEHYFNTDAAKLTPTQAARLAAALPAPKDRNPAKPTDFLRRRAAAILDGAETIRADGRAGCFGPAPAPRD